MVGYNSRETILGWYESLRVANPTKMIQESLGTTFEGRSMIMYKIGNPNGVQVLYDADIHGDELPTAEVLYRFINWLLQADTSDKIKILNNVCLYLIPILNIDSYAEHYNFINGSYEPSQYDFVSSVDRKNGLTPYGVDLNRNFSYNWSTIVGDSLTPSSHVYKGPSAGSELETQALTAFFNSHIKPDTTNSIWLHINLHTGYARFGGYNDQKSITIYNAMCAQSPLSKKFPCSFGSSYGAGTMVSQARSAKITSFLWEIWNGGGVNGWDTSDPSAGGYVCPYSNIDNPIYSGGESLTERVIPYLYSGVLQAANTYSAPASKKYFSHWIQT